MLSIDMVRIVQWLGDHAGLLAGAVTVAIAVLILCGAECCRCSRRERDNLFGRRSV